MFRGMGTRDRKTDIFTDGVRTSAETPWTILEPQRRSDTPRSAWLGSSISIPFRAESPPQDDLLSEGSTESRERFSIDESTSFGSLQLPDNELPMPDAQQTEARAMSFARKGKLLNAESLLKQASGPESPFVDRMRIGLEILAIRLQRGHLKAVEQGLDGIKAEIESRLEDTPSTAAPADRISIIGLRTSLVIWRSALRMSQGLYRQAASDLENLTSPGSETIRIIQEDVVLRVQRGIHLGICHAFAGNRLRARLEMDQVRESCVNEFKPHELASTSAILLMDERTNFSAARAKMLLLFGDYQSALRACQEALDTARTSRGSRHFQTLELASMEGQLLSLTSSPSKAEESCHRTLKLMVDELGMEHPWTLQTTGHLVDALLARSRFVEAIDTAKSLVKVCKAVLTVGHPSTLRARHQLSLSLQATGRYSTAEKKLVEIVETSVSYFGSDSPGTLRLQSNLAEVQCRLGETGSATRLAKTILHKQARIYLDSLAEKEDLVPEFNGLESWRATLAASNIREDGHPVMLESLRTYYQFFESSIDANQKFGVHPDVLSTLELLATMEAQDFNSAGNLAEMVMKFVCDQRARLYGSRSVVFLESQYQLALHYQGRDMLQEAKALLRQVWAERKEVLSPTNSQTLAAERDLMITGTAQGEASMDLEPAAANIADLHEWQLGKFHPETIKSLGWVHAVQTGFPDRSLEADKTLAVMKERLQDSSVLKERFIESVKTEDSMAWLCRSQGMHLEALRIWRYLVGLIQRSRPFRDESMSATLRALQRRIVDDVEHARPEAEKEQKPRLDDLVARAGTFRREGRFGVEEPLRREAYLVTADLYGETHWLSVERKIQWAKSKWNIGRSGSRRDAVDLLESIIVGGASGERKEEVRSLQSGWKNAAGM